MTFIIFLIIFIFILSYSIHIVDENEVAIVENLGKFSRVFHPGFHLKFPVLDKIQYTMPKSIWALNVNVETKTKDNVFVTLSISAQCKYDIEKIFEATYLMPHQSLLDHVQDKIRAIVPNYTLDELFQQKNEVASELKTDLYDLFREYGTIILNTLITELSPAENVKEAMNEINAAQRLKIAAIEKAEAEKIAVIKFAEGQAESKILQGKGIAGQRKAIVEGLRDSLDELKKHNAQENAINEQEAIMILLLNQHFDTLREIGSNSKTNTIFLNNHPSSLGNIMDELRNTMTQAKVASQEISYDIHNNESV